MCNYRESSKNYLYSEVTNSLFDVNEICPSNGVITEKVPLHFVVFQSTLKYFLFFDYFVFNSYPSLL